MRVIAKANSAPWGSERCHAAIRSGDVNLTALL
jgi:hypothetical protein